MSQTVKLLSSGEIAMKTVARILPTARVVRVPSALGAVDMAPGTIWRGNRMLVLVEGSTTYSTIDDRLYEWSTSDFIRDEWLRAAKDAGKGAEHWVVIAKAEMALLCGMFVPWYLLLGVTCAKVGVLYSTNKATIDQAVAISWRVLPKVLELRTKHPALFKAIRQSVTQRTWEELKHGRGVTAEDVAFFVGRLVQGLSQAPELSLTMFLRVLGRVAALVTATHFPGIVVHSAHAAASRAEEDLKKCMIEAGYTVTLDEAKEILREVRNNPKGVHDLEQIETALSALVPLLDHLRSSSDF